MRILITTATYPPSVNGVAYHTQLLFRSLTQLGRRVMILAPDHPRVDMPEAGIIRYPSFSSPLTQKYSSENTAQQLVNLYQNYVK